MIDFKQQNPNFKDFKIKVGLFGEPMTGKTFLALQFPKPLVLSTDGNYKHFKGDLAAIKIDTGKTNHVTDIHKREMLVDGWTYFKYLLNKVLIEEKDKFDTLIIDLADGLYDMCRNYWNEKYKIDYEGDLKNYDKADQYNRITKDFNNAITRLENLNKNLVIISHIMELETGETKPTLRGKIWDRITRLIDAEIITTCEETKEGNTQYVSTFRINRFGLKNTRIFSTYENIKNQINNQGLVLDINER